MTNRICKIDGCGKPRITRAWCIAHYTRWIRHGDPSGGGVGKSAALRFINETISSSPIAGCIIWPYDTSGNGYGRIQVNNIRYPAHRYILMQVDPRNNYEHLDASHAPVICHNKLCINPQHLRWATRKENLADMILDGTQQIGSANPLSKLTSEQVLAIREDERPQSIIAEEYGVEQTNISHIKLRKSWKHL